LATLFKAEWPFLVICPSSLRFNWRDEIMKWLEDIKPQDIQVVVKTGKI
jgi:SNF2 family DNA or RNA helicase